MSKKRIGKEADEVITFEHININGINPHDEFVELKNTMGILEKMETGIYIIVETQWDTTSPVYSKYIKDIIKREDKYAHIETLSNMDEKFESAWKPGGTLVEISGDGQAELRAAGVITWVAGVG